MHSPILKQGHILIATVQESSSDKDIKKLQSDLSKKVGKFRSHGVIIDVTALDVIDSFATRTLRDMAETTKLRGAKLVIVGIQPDVAFSMVQLGLTLYDIETALDLEEGIEILEKNKQKRLNL